MRLRTGILIALGGLAALGLSGCGDDGNEKLTVVLSEWIVQPDQASVAAGDVDIVADNVGGETHELVIVRGDDPTTLPTDENGTVIEAELDERDFIGEIEEFPAQQQREQTFTCLLYTSPSPRD